MAPTARRAREKYEACILLIGLGLWRRNKRMYKGSDGKNEKLARERETGIYRLLCRDEINGLL
jgi:hypothetical protein